MLLFIYLNLFTYYPEDLRENTINNNCDFNIIRFKRNEVMCIDYGLNKKYCNHFILPNEFIVLKELAAGNNEKYIIKPYAIYEESSYNKVKLADFYYSFTCSNEDNEARLLLNIVPDFGKDKSLLQEFVEVIIILFIIFISIIILSLICNYNDNHNYNNNHNFVTGYIVGNMNHTRRIYYE